MGLPIPNLDDKTFEELVKEARALISRYSPEWTDHNVHDPGITFIELFAWLAEMQNYQLNRVTEANYKKFLGLLGLQPNPPRPSRVDVTFAGVSAVKFLEKGKSLIVGAGAEPIFFEIEEDFTLVPLVLKSIISSSGEKRIENIQANGKDDICFAPFSKAVSEDASLELGFSGNLPGEKINLLFDLFEGDLPTMTDNAEIFPSVVLAWEYLVDRKSGKWSPLTIDKDSTFALTRSGRIAFAWPTDVDENAGCYWVRCRMVEGNYEIPPLINAILLNSISAVQVETVRDDIPGTGFPGQLIQLKNSIVIPGSLKIELQGDKGAWEEVADFDSSGPDDRHYTYDSATGIITFGNGLNGLIPPPKEKQNISVSYRFTLGRKGNVPAGQRFTVAGGDGLVGTNLSPAAGGGFAESLEEAKMRAKKDLRSNFRAITAADYEAIALATPGIRVKRATAIPGYHPEYPCVAMPGVVTVVVVPLARKGAPPPIPGEGFRNTVAAHLNRWRLVATDLYVVGPKYVTVSVSCKVHTVKKSDPKEVTKRVMERLAKFLNPFTGGPEEKGWTFGRPVYPSEIYQLLDKTEGVDFATGVVLTAKMDSDMIDGDKGEIIRISRYALVVSGDHQVNIL